MRDIKNYEGLYAITSCGKVWSYRSQKFLKQNKAGAGYYFVALSKNGVETQFYVHRLVASTYLPNPDNLPEVDHIDNCKEHNYLQNLKWVDHLQNIQKQHGTKVICKETGEIFNSLRAAASFVGGNHHGVKRAIETGNPYHNYHFNEVNYIED